MRGLQLTPEIKTTPATEYVMEDDEDAAMIMGLSLAVDICPGCRHANPDILPIHYCMGRKPCPMFHPDNFYYNADLHRFWCYNWSDSQGRSKPVQN